jgi:hypothetical protein
VLIRRQSVAPHDTRLTSRTTRHSVTIVTVRVLGVCNGSSPRGWGDGRGAVMDHPNEVGRTGVRGERSAFDARDRVLQALLRSDVFTGVERSQLVDLAESSAYHRIPRRRRLYAQGELVAGLYVVAAGRVRVVRGGESRALTVAYRGVGEVIGEIAVTQRKTPQPQPIRWRWCRSRCAASKGFWRVRPSSPDVCCD